MLNPRMTWGKAGIVYNAESDRRRAEMSAELATWASVLDGVAAVASRAFQPGRRPLTDHDRQMYRRAAYRLLAALDGDRDAYLANCL